jgi:hypothetical protein
MYFLPHVSRFFISVAPYPKVFLSMNVFNKNLVCMSCFPPVCYVSSQLRDINHLYLEFWILYLIMSVNTAHEWLTVLFHVL